MSEEYCVVVFEKGRVDKVVGPFTYDEASDWITDKINNRSYPTDPNVEYGIREFEKP